MANLPIKIMMESKLHELHRILSAEYEVFVRCLEKLNEGQRLSRSDNEIASAADHGHLKDLLLEAAALEARRVNLIEIISRDLNLTSENKLVGELLDSLKGTKLERLTGLKRAIIEACEKADRQKRLNDTLIRKSIDIIRKTGNNVRRNDFLGNAGPIFDEISRGREPVRDRTAV